MTDILDQFRTPGQYLKHLLELRGWQQTVLAAVLGVTPSYVARLANDKRPIEAQKAIALAEIFDVPAKRFLDLQQSYDLARAELTRRPDPGLATRARLYGEFPVAEMIRRGWLLVESVKDVKAVETAMASFFGVQDVGAIPGLPHAAKKTVPSQYATPAQLAWLYRVRAMASEMIVAPYSVAALKKAISKLADLLRSPSEIRRVPRILAEAGIRFVIVESLSVAKIDGACLWLDDSSPVVGLSLRHDRIDNFWFVLRHELEHVLQGHGKTTPIVDADLEKERLGTGPDIEDDERAANLAAADFCVPASKLQQFVSRKAPVFATRDLLGFAQSVQVHPGLVAGQLQHQTGRYDRFRTHLVKIRSEIVPNAAVDGWGDIYPVEQAN